MIIGLELAKVLAVLTHGMNMNEYIVAEPIRQGGPFFGSPERRCGVMSHEPPLACGVYRETLPSSKANPDKCEYSTLGKGPAHKEGTRPQACATFCSSRRDFSYNMHETAN